MTRLNKKKLQSKIAQLKQKKKQQRLKRETKRNETHAYIYIFLINDYVR